ncbi:recombinase family protein [Gorillibacterium massiliense]|uniref:recombinase family protein n=1 Tax=Gorillibacterium massiliense TaxID=1280390 RepID=UPI000593EDAF|nr:recombinase family protein [Gorillibacterium massiliense]
MKEKLTINIKSQKIGFYIRGETPRTLSAQQYDLQQFCKDYNIPIEDVLVIRDVAGSDGLRPQLDQVMRGEWRIDILAMRSPHILHLFHNESEQLAEKLRNLGIAVLYVNSNKEQSV